MLWFDVTDLQRWHHSHLTGIQRTAVGVLSELLQLRKDVGLFCYDEATRALQVTTSQSLSEIVRRHLDQAGSDPDSAPAVDSYTPAILGEARTSRSHASLAAALAPVAPLAYATGRLRSRSGRFLRPIIGAEMTDALRDFLRSGFHLLRVIKKKLQSALSRANRIVINAAKKTKIISEGVGVRPIVFQPGDVCLSLSATWGIHRYGETIAENKTKYRFKCVSMIYDLIPTLYPQWLTPGASRVVTLWVRQQIRNADVILTISNFQKQEIAKYIEDERLPSPPVEVVRLGDNPNFYGRKGASNSPPLPRFVPDRKFAICVSTLDIRKNQSVLYQVWRRLAEDLKEECPQLLLIGTPHLYVTDLLYQIRHDRLVNRLIMPLTGITDEELAWYYRHCLFTLYPSVYEGWGLPISESLAVGKYCIAGDRTSLPEAGGDFVDYFDPLDVPACYRLVRRAIDDPDYVKMRETNIRENYKPYSWRMTAQSISQIVDECIATDVSTMSMLTLQR